MSRQAVRAAQERAVTCPGCGDRYLVSLHVAEAIERDGCSSCWTSKRGPSAATDPAGADEQPGPLMSPRSLLPAADQNHPRRGSDWTTTEIRRLREIYPEEGIEAAMQALPGRTAAAIYSKVSALGVRCRRKKRPRRRRWKPTPEIDAEIRRVYESDPKPGAVNALARRVERPRWWVSKRATKLGLKVPRFKEPPWTTEEDTILEATIDYDPDVVVRKLRSAGFQRSATAVVVRRKRINLSLTADRSYYSAFQVSKLLGVDTKTVSTWIANGWLTATKRGTDRTEAQGGDTWKITRAQLRRFMREHPMRIDLRKVDQLWFIDFALGG